MELSLSKLPWYGQVGAFVFVAAGSVFGFWTFYVGDMQADIATRQGTLVQMQQDLARGVAVARRLPEFQSQVTELEGRLASLRAVLPEQKDVADILRRVQGLATESNLSIQRFTPQPQKQEALYAALPFKLTAEGTYHDLGLFLERIGKFHRIINVSDIVIKAKAPPEGGATIVAECTATTFVLQEQPVAAVPVTPMAKAEGGK
jgi:type IV pilus assembly protein PilO